MTALGNASTGIPSFQVLVVIFANMDFSVSIDLHKDCCAKQVEEVSATSVVKSFSLYGSASRESQDAGRLITKLLIVCFEQRILLMSNSNSERGMHY